MKFEDVEAARITYANKTSKYMLVSVIIAFAVAIITSVGSRSFILYGVVSGLLVFGIGAVITALLTRKEAIAYKKTYKGYFVERNLKNIFTDLKYTHQDGISSSLLKSTGMINTGDVYSSNDLTIAKYKNIGFVQADAHIQTESTDSDGNTTYTTIFKGRFMIFEFPKKFNFKLELIGKRFGAYRIPSKDQNTGRKMVKIETESPEFQHFYKVFGQDGFETFYILDPAFIVKLQDIAEHYKRKVLLGFYDNKMLVALNDGKDSFEPPKPYKPINEQIETEKVAKDIKIITDFVDIISSH